MTALGAGEMDYTILIDWLRAHAPETPLLRDEVLLPYGTADVAFLNRMAAKIENR